MCCGGPSPTCSPSWKLPTESKSASKVKSLSSYPKSWSLKRMAINGWSWDPLLNPFSSSSMVLQLARMPAYLLPRLWRPCWVPGTKPSCKVLQPTMENTFSRFSRSAKKEAQAYGKEWNCPPWRWWPQSPLLDVWPKAHQKWSCNPVWSESFGTSYLALQECRPCKPAGQKMVQKQWWHRLRAVGGRKMCEAVNPLNIALIWPWEMNGHIDWKCSTLIAAKLKHPYDVNSAPSAFKALCQLHWLCIAMIRKIIDICNMIDIKENQTSQRHIGQGAKW